MRRLTGLLDRYGEAIAADLAFVGWDVVHLVEQGRWAFCLNLIDHLPRTSAYRDAVAQDEDLAERLLDEPLPAARTPMTEWSAEAEALAVIADRLWSVCNVITQSVGGKATPVKAYPRPVTAIARARAHRGAEEAAALVAKFSPRA